jgi:hypothetical protein
VRERGFGDLIALKRGEVRGEKILQPVTGNFSVSGTTAA